MKMESRKENLINTDKRNASYCTESNTSHPSIENRGCFTGTKPTRRKIFPIRNLQVILDLALASPVSNKDQSSDENKENNSFNSSDDNSVFDSEEILASKFEDINIDDDVPDNFDLNEELPSEAKAPVVEINEQLACNVKPVQQMDYFSFKTPAKVIKEQHAPLYTPKLPNQILQNSSQKVQCSIDVSSYINKPFKSSVKKAIIPIISQGSTAKINTNDEGNNGSQNKIPLNIGHQNNVQKSIPVNDGHQNNVERSIPVNYGHQSNVQNSQNYGNKNNVQRSIPQNNGNQNNIQRSIPLEPTQRCIFVNNIAYTVLGVLGKGGSSVVYHCYEPRIKLVCAIKCVNLNQDDVTVRGYINEVELLHKLQNCDRIIKMYGYQFDKSQKRLYMVLEKGGADLSKMLKDLSDRSTRIPMYMLIYYWMQMLYAVKEIHSNGIIHSDLKPANFINTENGIKLIDFGIASCVHNDNTSVVKSVAVGTFSYISPESLKNDSSTNPSSPSFGEQKYKISYKSDVWSLGCILYQLVYRRTVFQHVGHSWAKISLILDPNHKIEYPPLDWVPKMITETMKACLRYNMYERPSVDDLIKLYEIYC